MSRFSDKLAWILGSTGFGSGKVIGIALAICSGWFVGLLMGHRVEGGCGWLTQDGWYFRTHELGVLGFGAGTYGEPHREAQILVEYDAGVFRFRVQPISGPCQGPGCGKRSSNPAADSLPLITLERTSANLDIGSPPQVRLDPWIGTILSVDEAFSSSESFPPTPPPRSWR